MIKFKKARIRTSLFINPSVKDIKLSRLLGVDCVEIHTGKLSNNVKLKKKYSDLHLIHEITYEENKKDTLGSMNHHNTDSTLIIIIIIIICICSLCSSCLSSLVGLYHSGLEFDLDFPLDFPFGEVGYVFMNDLWVITDEHDQYNADVGDNCLSEMSIEEAKTECNENDDCRG